MPIWLALDCSWVISCSIQVIPVEYGRVKESCWPCLMPGTHAVGLEDDETPPGVVQPEMAHPWLVSSDFALVGLYGNGSPFIPVADRKGVTGSLPTGPTVGTPYPFSGPAITAAWFITSWSASRKYSCLMIGPLPVVDW